MSKPENGEKVIGRVASKALKLDLPWLCFYNQHKNSLYKQSILQRDVRQLAHHTLACDGLQLHLDNNPFILSVLLILIQQVIMASSCVLFVTAIWHL